MTIKEAIIVLISDLKFFTYARIIELCQKEGIFENAKIVSDFFVDSNSKAWHIEDCISELKSRAAEKIANKLEKL